MMILLKPIPIINKILCKLGIHKVWHIDGQKHHNMYCMYCGKKLKEQTNENE